mgnify:CR=1 FL=1
METFDRLTRAESRRHARRFLVASVLVVIATVCALGFFDAFAPNRPVDYENDPEHFYYGSIGADISGGLPLKVMQVLPGMFPEYLPEGAERRDYTAFGFIRQPGRKMPIGFSTRRRFIDFTGMNCGTCHTGSVRESPQAEPMTIPGMPANTVDLLGFFKFLFKCAGDERFNARNVVAAMEEAGIAGPADPLIYRFVVPRLKEALLRRKRRLEPFLGPGYPAFGPGRVNTFDPFKFEQFAYYYEAHGEEVEEIHGTVDFPSIWNQKKRQGLWLHWDGNNDSVRERNFSAAIGAGAEPQDMDIEGMFRIEEWLETLSPPSYPFPIDEERAGRGRDIFRKYCYDCHDFGGERVGTVVPIEQIGTDRHRMDSYTPFILEAQKDYTKGYFWAFEHFRKTHGYANHPLDGIWARGPYLHNGSVPSLWDLLTPAEARPEVFTRGSDVYDQEKMGFAHEVLSGSREGGYSHPDGRPYRGTAFVFDTRLPGNDNGGHAGRAYGTELSEEDKRALIEYLKWRDRPRERR